MQLRVTSLKSPDMNYSTMTTTPPLSPPLDSVLPTDGMSKVPQAPKRQRSPSPSWSDDDHGEEEGSCVFPLPPCCMIPDCFDEIYSDQTRMPRRLQPRGPLRDPFAPKLLQGLFCPIVEDADENIQRISVANPRVIWQKTK
eukprot:scaffold2490_cov169-Amphora_coffeaeformis.AAC.10